MPLLMNSGKCMTCFLVYVCMYHRWARLLSQQTSINVYCLPTKENERPFPLKQLKGCLPFSFSVCRKQLEVAAFCQFRFANSRNMETMTWSYVDGDIRAMKMETQRHMDIETWTWRHQTDDQTRPFTVCLLCKQKLVIFTSVDEETNESHPFANGLNGLNGHSHLRYIQICSILEQSKRFLPYTACLFITIKHIGQQLYFSR